MIASDRIRLDDLIHQWETIATEPHRSRRDVKFPCPAIVVIESWGGRQRVNVTLLSETPKRYKARVEDAFAHLPGRGRHVERGFVWNPPKTAVVIGDVRDPRPSEP